MNIVWKQHLRIKKLEFPEDWKVSRTATTIQQYVLKPLDKLLDFKAFLSKQPEK